MPSRTSTSKTPTPSLTIFSVLHTAALCMFWIAVINAITHQTILMVVWFSGMIMDINPELVEQPATHRVLTFFISPFLIVFSVSFNLYVWINTTADITCILLAALVESIWSLGKEVSQEGLPKGWGLNVGLFVRMAFDYFVVWTGRQIDMSIAVSGRATLHYFFGVVFISSMYTLLYVVMVRTFPFLLVSTIPPPSSHPSPS